MRLFNTTPLTAEVTVGEPFEAGFRVGMLTAKATFSFDANGYVRLDEEEPFPILKGR